MKPRIGPVRRLHGPYLWVCRCGRFSALGFTRLDAWNNWIAAGGRPLVRIG